MSAHTAQRQAVAGGGPRSAPAMVGRAAALGKVTDALSAGSALVLIEGEAGIGKSRLLREALAARADNRPSNALLATCPAVPDPSPLGAVAASIRRLQPLRSAVGLSPLGGALRPLFPEWANDLPPAPQSLDDPIAVRHMLFRALAELVERLGIDVLVIEDAHWADATTLEWLLTLCADEPAGPGAMSIVLTFRPWDVPAGSLLPRLTSRTPPGRSRIRVELTALDVEQVRQLVASMYSAEHVSDQFAEFLHASTDGVPLVVEEYLLLLQDRDDIAQRDGQWTRKSLAELDVPASVRESVLERVHRLDGATQRLLEAASVLADPADEKMLGDVADLSDDDTRQAMAAALGSGLLREQVPGRFVFRHVLDAQAISGAVPVSERRRFHARAAAILERGNHAPAARLAHHFGAAGDTERWRAYTIASAELALDSGDDRTAVETLLRVLKADQPTEQRVMVAHALGRAAFFGAAALGALADQVVDALRGVLDVADVAGSDRGELRLLLGRMLWAIGEKPAAFEQFEASVRDLGHRPDLAIRAMSNLALPLVPDWPAARHRAWLERARELVDRVSYESQLAFLDTRSTVLLLLGEPAGWDAFADVPTTPATREEQRAFASWLLNAVWAMLAWGRFGEAAEQLAVVQRHIEVAGYSRLAHLAQATRACLDWYTGNWAGLADRAVDLAGDTDADRSSRLHARHVLGMLHLATGSRSEARRTLRAAVAEYARLGITEPAFVSAPAALGRIQLADGDHSKALAATKDVVELIARKGVWMWIADIATVHLDALIGAQRHEQASAFVTTLSTELGGRDLPAAAAALATCRAIMLQANGNPAAAADEFAAAQRLWASLPRPYDALLCLERAGRALLAAGKRDQALATLEDCQQRLHELGARRDADRVAQLVREHGVDVVRTWHGGRRGYGNQLSPRELEVVRLVITGMTNRRVAETLFVSPRTVEGHVTSAMRKLGVTTRTALARVAVEAGLADRGTQAA